MRLINALITVIVPFYKGNSCINQLMNTIIANAVHLAGMNVNLELLIVNDSPEEQVIYDKTSDYPFHIRILSSGKNQGIHGARCYGIRHARGNYIVMLDQDDTLSDTWMMEQIQSIKTNDLAISNAIYCGKRRKEICYSSERDMHRACDKWTLCLKGNQIVSPGQVLIKKDCIPKEWMKLQMKVNGADDYLLWILLFERKRKVAYNLNTYYYHQYTKESVSNRENMMRKSKKEMTKLIENYYLVNWIRRKIYISRYL